MIRYWINKIVKIVTNPIGTLYFKLVTPTCSNPRYRSLFYAKFAWKKIHQYYMVNVFRRTFNRKGLWDELDAHYRLAEWIYKIKIFIIGNETASWRLATGGIQTDNIKQRPFSSMADEVKTIWRSGIRHLVE